MQVIASSLTWHASSFSPVTRACHTAGCPSHGVLTVLTGRNIHKQSPQVTSVPSHRTPQDKYSDTRTVLQAPIQVGKVQVLNTHHTNTNAMQRLRGKTGALTDGNCRVAARTFRPIPNGPPIRWYWISWQHTTSMNCHHQRVYHAYT